MRNPLSLALVLILSTAATAQIDPSPDRIGIYFDEDAIGSCTWTTTPYEEVTAYLVLTNPSLDGNWRNWGARIWTTGPALAPSWFVHGFDSDYSETGFTVGMMEMWCCPLEPATVLGWWSALIPEPGDKVTFHITGFDDPTEEVQSPPQYANWDESIRDMFIPGGAPGGVVAQITSPVACGVVADEPATFGRLKTLFR